jgi:Zn-dependent protease with chaperone function
VSAGFVVLSVAAGALVAAGASLGVGATLRGVDRWLTRCAPDAQARVLLAAALAPAMATAALLLAAWSPNFGWIVDHCTLDGDPHGSHHPHLCTHHGGGWPGLPLALVAAVFAMRLAWTGLRAAWGAWLAHRATRELLQTPGLQRDGDAWVLPIDAPHAFVIGVWPPRLFVTRGLCASAARQHLDAIRAHELAHVENRDTARKLIAHWACGLHVPLVGARIEAQLDRALELAADDFAARSVGSCADVAQALVDMARAALVLPVGARAFAVGHVEARVLALLDDGDRTSGPSARVLVCVIGLALAAVAMQADAVHHGVEVVLGWLAG